jgi:fibronectin type 3 domain-containing protein
MQSSIASFNSSTLALWNGSKPPVLFSAHAMTATSGLASQLLTPGQLTSVSYEINGLQALGAKAIVVNIDYPILDPGFDPYGGQSAAYLAFYQNVANLIHAQGLKMIVETGGAFTDPTFCSLNAGPYFQTLTFSQYATGRANQAALIASAIKPDYLNVVQEPDTEATQTGFSDAYTLTGSLTLLNGILSAVKATGATMPVGAGIGSWLAPDVTGKSYVDYVTAYTSIPALDKLDIHVYPVINDYLNRLTTIAQLAQAAGNRVTMSECWDYTQRASEVNSPFFPPSVLYARDVFSFWAPIDNQFLQAMTNWAYYENLEYLAAFWTTYFRAYLNYDSSTQNLAPNQLLPMVQNAAGAAITVPAVTNTGTAWPGYIVNPADTTPPSAPAVTATLYPTQIALKWPPATDNVGVYKYTVSRSGMSPVTTVSTAFTESGLVSCGKYVYTISAFDFRNNKSSTTTSTLTTPDNVPPTAPTSLTVTPGAVVSGNPATTSMKLTWSGATDNCGPGGIASYLIARSVAGGAFATLAQVPSSPSSYTDSGIQKSATQFCYQLVTVDQVGLKSPASAVVCATTKDFQPPTVPAGLSATMGTPPNVSLSWNASTDDVAVAGYDIQRRQGTSGSFGILASSVTSTSYSDTTASQLPDNVAPTASVVSPAAGSGISKTITFQASASDKGVATTYTYQVRAGDTSGNKSVWGTAATITWPVVGGTVASVAFYVDGVQVGNLTAAPWYIRWNSTTVANGSHTFTVKATDAAGNSSTSSPITATVSN